MIIEVPPIAYLGNFVGPNLIGALLIAFWIWMLVEAITKEPTENNHRLTWVLVIALTQVIGAAIYYFVRRPERIRKYGR